MGEPGSLLGKHLPEKGIATHCSIFACRIPRTEVPGGLQSTGVANSLSMTEWVRDSISLDSRVNVLCVKCSTHISLSLAVKKSLIQKKSDAKCRGGENMESGAWEQGTGSWFHGSCGRDSAFICITRRHCTQYSFHLLFQFIVDFF